MTKGTSAAALATPAASREAPGPTEQATFAVYLWLSGDEAMCSTVSSIANACGHDREAGVKLQDYADQAIGRRPVLLSARIRAALTQDVDWTAIGQSFRTKDGVDGDDEPFVTACR